MKEVKAVKEENQIVVDRLNELLFKAEFGGVNNPHGIKSKRKLAEYIHISAQALGDIFKGKNKLSTEHAKNIAEAFPGIDPAWLLGVDEKTLKNKESEIQERINADIESMLDFATNLLYYCGFDSTFDENEIVQDRSYTITKNKTGEKKVVYTKDVLSLWIKSFECLKPVYELWFSTLSSTKKKTAPHKSVER